MATSKTSTPGRVKTLAELKIKSFAELLAADSRRPSELFGLFGISRSYYYDLKKGRKPKPTPWAMQRIAKALGVELDVVDAAFDRTARMFKTAARRTAAKAKRKPVAKRARRT